MKWKNISLLSAYQQVRDVRPVICPNNGFFKVLQEYQDELLNLELDEERRDNEIFQYTVFQLMSQLDFAGVTEEKATTFLKKYKDPSVAASYLIEDAGF